MKLVNAGKWMVRVGLLLFLLQNVTFGWNAEPMSKIEEIVDIVNLILVYGGVIIYITPVFDIYEKVIKENESK